MPIFFQQNGEYRKLKNISFGREKELQTIVEKNLSEFFEMYFLETEYPTTSGGRIDTLAVDKDGAPVIIEYKRNKNDNVINQSLSYLKWLQAQKEEFFQMLILRKLSKETVDTLKIDWKHPRVVCIAEAYNKFDTDTVEVIPIRIELYTYQIYENGLLSITRVNSFEQIERIKDSGAALKLDSKPLENFLHKGSDETRRLFKELRERIKVLDEKIEERETKDYMGYRITLNFAEIHLQKNQIRIHLRPIEYIDPRRIVEKISDGYKWTMNRRVYLKKLEDLDDVMMLIEQSYHDVL